jgi:hypothetical protein
MPRCKSKPVTSAEVKNSHRRAVGGALLPKSSRLGFSFYVTGLIFTASLLLNSSSSYAWQSLAAIAKSAPHFLPPSGDGGPAPIAELIDQLNSPAFARRQSATVSIIEHGASALPKLSQRFFESSPEVNYRIRKSLEGIASAGDEETFLKSSAILLTLYSNGNDQIFQQIEELKAKWQTQRTEFAIAALKRTGAEVVQQRNNNARAAQRIVIARKALAKQLAGVQQVKFVKRTVAQQKEMVQTILASDAQSNRDFIFELMPGQPRVNQSASVGSMGSNLPYLAGTRIIFPADWGTKNTDASAFEELREINDRLFVTFASADLSNAQWAALAAADNVVVLNISAGKTSTKIPAPLPTSLQLLTLSGFDLDRDWVDSIQRSAQLQQLELANCEFDQSLAQSIDKVPQIKSIVCRPNLVIYAP